MVAYISGPFRARLSFYSSIRGSGYPVAAYFVETSGAEEEIYRVRKENRLHVKLILLKSALPAPGGPE